MAKMMILGNTLVSESEFNEKIKSVENLAALAENGESSNDKVEMANGIISVETMKEEMKFADVNGEGEELSYEPIGIGKPLSIEILTMYTGDFKKKISIGKRQLLLMSAIKSSVTYDSQAKAINMLVRSGKEHKYLDFSAMEEGTRVVFYSPAVDTDSYELSFSFLADNFDKDLIDKIAKAFSIAATIPVFVTFSTLLLAGSQLLSIAAEGGNKFLQKDPMISESLRLQFGIGGLTNSVSRKILICENHEEFSGYEIKKVDEFGKISYRLFDKASNKSYSGDEPYMIINIDGRKRDSLESFTPKLATAAILEKFGQNDTDSSLGVLEDAMTLYNDYKFKVKASKAKAELDTLTPTDANYEKQNALYKAYKANILNDIFKE